MKAALERLETPCYVIDQAGLERNLQILKETAEQAGCRILLAQKAFSAFALYPMMRPYLAGTTASGLYEARLGNREMGGETHIFSPAYKAGEFEEICRLCGHVVFNSLAQWEAHRETALAHGVSCGLRINPEHSTQSHGIYDPCAPGSRLGIRRAQLPDRLPEGIQGLHFHTLCEQNFDALAETLAAVEAGFAPFLTQVRWVNFGGGHHITRADYDRVGLAACIRDFRRRYGVEVYLEPGEAVALGAGYLLGTVLDVVENGLPIAILDVSAACHMPDVLEMPYRPPLAGAGAPGEKPCTFRLAGNTCLAGDVIGDYSFDRPLRPGDRLCFEDMAIYTMVKNNTFNGTPLPSIALLKTDGTVQYLKNFGYEDFKNRLS